MEQPKQVFICYAREDVKAAERLYDDLTQAGVAPWWDREKLLPGQKWKAEIQRALKQSEAVIFLLSSHSVSKRGFVQKELKDALDLLQEIPSSDIFLIPARLDASEPLDEQLQELHAVDLFPSYEAGLQRILRIVKPGNRDISAVEFKDSPLRVSLSNPQQLLFDKLRANEDTATSTTLSLTKPPPHTPAQRQRDLDAEYDLLSEKLGRLRKARILETDAAVLFKLDKQIEEAEQQLVRLEQISNQTP